jgi:hypothetical protein
VVHSGDAQALLAQPDLVRKLLSVTTGKRT